MIQCLYKSEVGPIYLVASDEGLHGLYWKKQSIPMGTHSLISQTIEQLEEYFAGKRTTFNIKIVLKGTPFQMKVWKELQKIPYGKCVSYKDIALKLKNPKALRAIGAANGKNPICLIVPCHRVIGSNGTLTGYAGGIKTKKKLLELENKKASRDGSAGPRNLETT